MLILHTTQCSRNTMRERFLRRSQLLVAMSVKGNEKRRIWMVAKKPRTFRFLCRPSKLFNALSRYHCKHDCNEHTYLENNKSIGHSSLYVPTDNFKTENISSMNQHLNPNFQIIVWMLLRIKLKLIR